MNKCNSGEDAQDSSFRKTYHREDFPYNLTPVASSEEKSDLKENYNNNAHEKIQKKRYHIALNAFQINNIYV